MYYIIILLSHFPHYSSTLDLESLNCTDNNTPSKLLQQLGQTVLLVGS